MSIIQILTFVVLGVFSSSNVHANSNDLCTTPKEEKISFITNLLFPKTNYAKVDSIYIAPFKYDVSLGIYTYYEFLTLSHEVDNQINVTYKPNIPVGLGISGGYKNFFLSGGLSIPFFKPEGLGDTRTFNFQYHYYGRKFIFDFFFQNYKGFYTQDSAKIVTLYPDLRLAQYAFIGQYIFNDKKFSYRAAFDQKEQQVKSAGSFQLGGGFYYNRIASDGSVTMYNENRLNSYLLNISGGYIYTWVIKKRVHLTLGLAAGINIGTTDHTSTIELSPSLFPRISAGYNKDTWSLGVAFCLNRTYVSNNKDLKMFFDNGYTRMFFIKRLNAPTFMQKIKILN